MQNKAKGNAICFFALMLDVLPPVCISSAYFPIWVERSAEATVSGMFLILGLLSSIPLFRVIKERLKSPSAPLVWLILCVMFYLIETIVREVKIIALVGFISNLAGAAVYKLGKHIIGKESKDGK